jgi:hypothetical protein
MSKDPDESPLSALQRPRYGVTLLHAVKERQPAGDPPQPPRRR